MHKSYHSSVIRGFKIISFLLASLVNLSPANPFFSNEIAAFTPLNESNPAFEWTFYSAYGFNSNLPISIDFEHILSIPTDSMPTTGEASSLFMYNANSFSNISVGARAEYTSNEFTPSGLIHLGFSGNIPKTQVLVGCTHELAITLNDFTKSYTLTVFSQYNINDQLALGAEYEGGTELIKGAIWEDNLEAGASYTLQAFTLGAFAYTSIAADPNLGFKISASHSF